MDEISLKEFVSGSLTIVIKYLYVVFVYDIESKKSNSFALDTEKSYLEKYKRGKIECICRRACIDKAQVFPTKSRMRLIQRKKNSPGYLR